MSRDKRVDDNWALLAAQSVALNNKVPLIVCFQYLGHFPEANIGQYGFLLKGLLELKNKLEGLNIEFILSQGRASEVIPRIIDEKVVGKAAGVSRTGDGAASLVNGHGGTRDHH